MLFQQKSFSGGLDRISGDTKIANDGYDILVNARQRYGEIEPIQKHVKLSTPAGEKQAIVSIGSTQIIFVAGKAYFSTDEEYNTWIQVPGFLMSTTAEQFYTLVVPSSTFNFGRTLDEAGNADSQLHIKANIKVSGTPSGILVQDGESQPFVIFFDSVNQIFTSRVTKTYAQWSNNSKLADDREYVPIGKQMMFLNQKTYIVSRDGKRIYQGVTGRPLDFMVNVDINGNKLPTESQGGAESVSFAFDSDEITCIKATNVSDTFLLGTRFNTRLIALDYNRLIFGEPTYRESSLINAGIINQESGGIDILGDYAIISVDGIKTFNAVEILKNRGNNNPFSVQLAGLLKNIKQSQTAAVVFDNYALFSITTSYGVAIAVYDTLLQKWVAFDITKVARVKQFCIVETESAVRLFAITKLNELYEMFASDSRYTAMLKTKSFVHDATCVEHKTQYFRPLFKKGKQAGKYYCMEFVDDEFGQQTNVDLDASISGIPFPVFPPVIPSDKQRSENAQQTMTKGLSGNRIHFILQWNTDAKLTEFELMTDDIKKDSSGEQKNNTLKEAYANNS